ncbi:hypothetical protein LSH36_95g02005 [Paralvinella palmiformis]|uniref:Polycystin cation channel PKD1/PKD2 domain-containing protein n=1 Tax=Paralvinella palmiformis TaxID=53620 RepID=A0AAD9K0G7_9ANNE|nr:hypothetical protein LSH36_95g02005 [Paralvinella palmiformis]
MFYLSITEHYMNFALFAYYDTIQTYTVGTIVFMCNIKFLRLLRYNKHIAHFSATLAQSSNDLTSFSMSFSLIFLAFTCLVFLLFSEQQERFSTLTGVMESLFAMLIGKFDIGDTVALYRILGPIIFTLYAVLMYFITMNMFLAIIGDAYAKVVKNSSYLGDEYKVMDFIIQKIINYLGIKKEHHQVTEEKYMNTFETLNVHLDSLDKLITDDCREILRLESQDMITRSGSNKDDKIEDSKNKMQQITFLKNLQQKLLQHQIPKSSDPETA